MASYTFGSDDSMRALAHAMETTTTNHLLGVDQPSRHQHIQPYVLQLNPTDFTSLIYALRTAWECGDNNAGDLLPSIAASLDVDLI